MINRRLSGSGSADPVPRQRMRCEAVQIARVRNGVVRNRFLLPWQAEQPVDVAALQRLTA